MFVYDIARVTSSRRTCRFPQWRSPTSPPPPHLILEILEILRVTCSHGQVVLREMTALSRNGETAFLLSPLYCHCSFLVCFLLLGRCEGRPSFERETPGRPSFCLSHPPLWWRHLTPLPIAPRARTVGRHSPLGRSLPRASGRGPLPYIKFYCSSSARAACWKRRQALAW